MVSFVLGESGSGKTKYLEDRIRELAANQEVFLIVPEQFSFENERKFLFLLGEEKAKNVKVYSFTRLANYIFNALGGQTLPRLTDCARNVLMGAAIDKVRGKQRAFRNYELREDFVSDMVNLYNEMKTNMIASDQLLKAVDVTSSQALSDKIYDISLIMESFEQLVHEKYHDPLDDLEIAKNLILKSDIFFNTTIFFDGYKGFTAEEISLLCALFEKSKECCFALTSPSMFRKNGSNGEEKGVAQSIFDTVYMTIKQLVKAADKANVKVTPPVILNTPHRFLSDDICSLAKNLPLTEKNAFERIPEDIKVFEGRDIYEECEYVCAEINQLVMHYGYRYKDIAVVLREDNGYTFALKNAMDMYEIPMFKSIKEGITVKPIVKLVLTACAIACGTFSSDLLLDLVKTSLLGIAPDDINDLENYCYMWDIDRTQWENDFTLNPTGLSGITNEREKNLLDKINKTRAKVVLPLMELKDNLNSTSDMGEMVAYLYAYLEKAEVATNHNKFVFELKKTDAAKAEEESGLWDQMVSTLDDLYTSLSGLAGVPKRFNMFVALAVSSIETASIPLGIDQVTVGKAELSRVGNKRAVFAVGVNDGIFPKLPSDGGVLSSTDRAKLHNMGIELSQTPEEMIQDEQFIAYSVLTSPREKLFLSYSKKSEQGDEMQPSTIINEVREVFPNIKTQEVSTLPPELLVSSMSSAFNQYAIGKKNTAQSKYLAGILESSDYKERMEKVNDCDNDDFKNIKDKSTCTELFGETLKLSPSRLETFYGCPFKYYCQYGLEVKPLKKIELDNLEFGTVVHYLLENVFKKYDAKVLCQKTYEENKKITLEVLKQYMNENYGEEVLEDKRFIYLLNQLLHNSVLLVIHVANELALSHFDPVGFEVSIGDKDKGFTEVTSTSEEGRNIVLKGTIDRLDEANIQGKEYIRIVDYKTGGKTFDLSEVICGLNMQMLIYLSAVCKKSGKLPAGVLYLPGKPSYHYVSPGEKDETGEKAKKLIKSDFKMDGLVVNDDDVYTDMDPSHGYINITKNKDGTFSKSSKVATEKQLQMIFDYVEKKMGQMADCLGDGKIAPTPSDKCDYCDYQTICGNYNGETIERPKFKFDEAMDILCEMERKNITDYNELLKKQAEINKREGENDGC